MGEITRALLARGQRIVLSARADGSLPETYAVRGVRGQGGAAVCYRAERERDGRVETGFLKEFYPLEGAEAAPGAPFLLARDDDGQLTARTGAEDFARRCREYTEAYRLVSRQIADDPENEVLKNYLQLGELLYGVPGDPRARATVYVWSPGIAGKGFDDYLGEVRARPEYRADFHLRDILRAMTTLTRGIRLLHTAGMMHLDIKPSNFMLPFDDAGQVNPANVSLFDIDSLYSAYGDKPSCAGTPGFSAPELRAPARRIDNRADIYSIGATLFSAVIVSDEIPDGLYRDGLYDRLDQLVRHSRLITGSESNSDVRLISLIGTILKKCLAPRPAGRYDSCSKLLKDLESATFLAGRYAVEESLLGQNRRVAIVDVNEKGITDPVIVMQRLLYAHPLYGALGDDETELRALVIGSGTYGQRFIDLCLQAGQLQGLKLSVDALSGAPEEGRDSYLRFRPALSGFVNVVLDDHGDLDDDDRAYARLRFAALPGQAAFKRGDADLNRELVEAVAAEAEACGQPWHYVFVALGDDGLNRQVATLFAECPVGRRPGCPVCYVSERVRRAPKAPNKPIPVCVNQAIVPGAPGAGLEQMAFNAHVAWQRALNMNVAETREAFLKDRYNYEASLAFVLSARGIFHSLRRELGGEKWDERIGEGPEQRQAAAEWFDERILRRRGDDARARAMYAALVSAEHRRWVLSKVCDGWTAPLNAQGDVDLSICVRRGAVRDSAAMTHPCIAFSGDDMPLLGPEYNENHRAKWEDASLDPALDELDRMSLELHQRFRAAAEEVRRRGPLGGEDMAALRELASESGEDIERAFGGFEFCVRGLLNGAESCARRFDDARDTLLAALETAPEDVRAQAAQRLRLISRTLFPVVEACLYRNYKTNDEALIERLPFILTYRHRPHIALAFEDGRGDAAFANVAAATLLCPERLTWLYRLPPEGAGAAVDRLQAALDYLSERNARLAAQFIVAATPQAAAEQRAALASALEALKQKTRANRARLAECSVIDCDGDDQAADALLERAREADCYDGTTRLFDARRLDADFVRRVEEEGLPWFEFDWRRRRLAPVRGCDELRFVNVDAGVRVADMLSLMNAKDVRCGLPDFPDDWETLWRLYAGEDGEAGFAAHTALWRSLCLCLRDHERGQPPLARLPQDERGPAAIHEYVLPEPAFRQARALLRQLEARGVAGGGSDIQRCNGDSCRVRVAAGEALGDGLNLLFADPLRFLGLHEFEMRRETDADGAWLAVYCRTLSVRGLRVADRREPGGEARHERLYGLLDRLCRKGFIRGLRADVLGLISFDYVSPAARRALTRPEAVAELCACHRLIRDGRLDDIAWNCRFRVGEGGADARLAIVATRGFRSAFVECGGEASLYKLHSLAGRFGVGAAKVLIGASTADGAPLGVTALRERREIEDIGAIVDALLSAPGTT